MKLPFLGLIAGAIIGVLSGAVFPYGFSGYVAVLILACMDSVLGGVYAVFQEQFDIKIFISGFFCNGIIAVGLIFLGNHLNIDLSIAAIVVYGSRIFNNFSKIRRFLLNKP